MFLRYVQNAKNTKIVGHRRVMYKYIKRVNGITFAFYIRYGRHSLLIESVSFMGSSEIEIWFGGENALIMEIKDNCIILDIIYSPNVTNIVAPCGNSSVDLVDDPHRKYFLKMKNVALN